MEYYPIADHVFKEWFRMIILWLGKRAPSQAEKERLK